MQVYCFHWNLKNTDCGISKFPFELKIKNKINFRKYLNIRDSSIRVDPSTHRHGDLTHPNML